jgi:hypothetical protein
MGVGLIMVLLDGVAAGRDLRVTGAIAGLMAFPLSNSAFLTTILTHGLGLAVLLLFLMPRQVERSEEATPSLASPNPPDGARHGLVPGQAPRSW